VTGALTVQVPVPPAEAELAADALWQAGAVAVEERAAGPTTVLVAAAPDAGALVAAVAGRWPAEVVPVDLDAALDAWRAFARPVDVGPLRIVLGATGAPGEVVIDPGRAFGSGAHPSTRLALEALVEQVRGGERVLDVGCGSGVLAVAALVLGAGAALAVDIDPAARAATAANAARNGVADRLAVADTVCGRHDLAVANLLLPDHRSLAPAVVAALAPGGTLIASGVLPDQRDALAAAYGLDPVDGRAEDGWLVCRLSPRISAVRDDKR
jgi:ribosomal protein L11 methyltransferase